MTDAEKREAWRLIKACLARYRGGVFSTGENGGASGMMFFTDLSGQQFYIGGMARDDAKRVTDALNGVLRLVDALDRS